MINCDTHDDEYLESHYQFSQAILTDDHDRMDNMFQTSLYSKCQKDPLSTDAEYKHRNVILTAEGEYCQRCEMKAPLSLKILSCNEILKHKEITMVGASSLPGKLIKFLMEVGLSIPKKDDWCVVKNSISVLLDYWPYKELDLATLSDKRWFQIALTYLVLDRFAAEIDSHALQQKPYRNQLTEFVMRISESGRQSSFYDTVLRKLFSTVCNKKRRWVFDHVGPRMKYIITTDLNFNTEEDLDRILYMLRLSRKPGSPFEIRIVSCHFYVESISTLAEAEIYISTLAEIFQEINPEIVKWFSMKIKPGDVLKLDEILKPCVELVSLSLSLDTNHRQKLANDEILRQNFANDVSLLIIHHPTVKRLVFRNFEDSIVGYEDKYPLPTSLETLILSDSRVYFEHWTDASNTPHIRDLTIVKTSCRSQSEMEGCFRFIEGHAETLVSLHINLCMKRHQPTVDRLKRMAKCLAQFNKLQRFTYRVRNARDILEILLHVMPLIAINQSLNSYVLDSGCEYWRYDRDFLQALQPAMKTVCVGRKRLLDFAIVIVKIDEEFQDGFPIVEYEEYCRLWGVFGYERHFPDREDDWDEDDTEEDFQDA